MFQGKLQDLVMQLRRFPGVGEKTAQRLAMFLLMQPKEIGMKIAETMRDAVESYKECSVCHMLTESDPCYFCQDDERDTTRICVVENTTDVYMIEQTNEYHGRYFVLGNLLSPLDGIGPEQIHFRALQQLITAQQVQEVILALSPSAEGETTIHYIAEQFKSSAVTVTRLSTGLPFGGDLEFSSASTLTNAIKRRYTA